MSLYVVGCFIVICNFFCCLMVYIDVRRLERNLKPVVRRVERMIRWSTDDITQSRCSIALRFDVFHDQLQNAEFHKFWIFFCVTKDSLHLIASVFSKNHQVLNAELMHFWQLLHKSCVMKYCCSTILVLLLILAVPAMARTKRLTCDSPLLAPALGTEDAEADRILLDIASRCFSITQLVYHSMAVSAFHGHPIL